MPDRDDARALELLARFGRTATAFQVLAPGMEHWFDAAEGVDGGLIGFARLRSVWVVAGEPIAASTQAIAVAERFVTHATQHNKRVAFFATEGVLASSPRFRRVLIGEQPYWDPGSWSGHVSSHRSLREQLRRARAKGVSIREVDARDVEPGEAPADRSTNDQHDPRIRGELDELIARWAAGRPMPPMHFLVEVAPFVHARWRRLFVAEREGVAIALLSLAPVSQREGWLFEHLLRDPSAPNGTAELLIDFAMRQVANGGARWVTLGLAPLSGPVSGWLRMARTLARPFFNFRGLSAFKRKLRPTGWEPIYLAFPRERSSVGAMLDGLRAFANGSVVRFGMRTVLRGPPPLLRALEYSLIPWTVALMLVPTDPWFPSTRVHWLWIAFDVALWATLRALRRQWGRTLALSMAVIVSLDALVTTVEAVLWNGAHLRAPGDAVPVIAACVAPAIAAVVLWGAVRRHSAARPVSHLKRAS